MFKHVSVLDSDKIFFLAVSFGIIFLSSFGTTRRYHKELRDPDFKQFTRSFITLRCSNDIMQISFVGSGFNLFKLNSTWISFVVSNGRLFKRQVGSIDAYFHVSSMKGPFNYHSVADKVDQPIISPLQLTRWYYTATGMQYCKPLGTTRNASANFTNAVRLFYE